MQRFHAFLLLFFLLVSFRATDSPEKEKTYTVYINYPEYSVRASVMRENKSVHPKQFRTYYWYANNDIKTTDGGFDGKLLHGEYKSFYRDLNLKEQGRFVNGLKEGNWITWFRNGKIQEILHFKNGLINGYSETFDEAGKLIRKSDYRNGILHGKTIIYLNSTKDSTIIYRNGEPKLRVDKKDVKTKTTSHKEQSTVKQGKDTTVNKTKSIPAEKKLKKNISTKPVADSALNKSRKKNHSEISKPK